MSRKREAIFMGIGVLAGLALSGPAAQAADYLTARPSTQTFYINGQQTSLTAYLIGGSNYVRLRDIGRAVDFGVTYDAATNSVYINPDVPYAEEEAPSTQTTPTLSADITEESVQAVLEQLKQIYPTGTVFPTPYRSTSNGPYSRGIHCSGWATLCSDAAFGDLPWRRVEKPAWGQIRAGDLIRFDTETSGHVIVVLERMDDYIKVTESGNNNKTRWGGQYFCWWLEGQPGYTLYTRYPEQAITHQPWRPLHTWRGRRAVSPMLPPVRRFVPILRGGWQPYASKGRNAVSALSCAAVARCELHQCLQREERNGEPKKLWLF